ncbi:MAG: hypothetical protein ACTHQ3_11715 [Motilibacteraceae bacterium]
MRLRPTALLVGLLIASPALWRSLVEGTMPAGIALQRTLLSLVVASVGAAVLEAVVSPYVGGGGRRPASTGGSGGPQRRAGDLPAPRAAAGTEHGPGRVSMGTPAAGPSGGAGTGGPGGIAGVGDVSGGAQ